MAQTPDCERVRDHGIAQPVNTLTSAAYGVASLPVLFAVRRSTGLLRMELYAYAGALVAVMAGSAHFHARGPGSSHRLHDGSLYAAILLGSLLLLPTAGTLADTRAGRRFLLAAATACATYACGRSSSRFCRPDSLWQFHALWHVLSAGTAALVAFVATDGRHEQRHSTEGALDRRVRTGVNDPESRTSGLSIAGAEHLVSKVGGSRTGAITAVSRMAIAVGGSVLPVRRGGERADCTRGTDVGRIPESPTPPEEER